MTAPGEVRCEMAQAIFSQARARMNGRKKIRLSIGSLKAEVECGEEIFARWLMPALSPMLSPAEDGDGADMRLCIALGREAEGMQSLCEWVGRGAAQGIYEVMEEKEGRLLFEHASQFWFFWSPARREGFVWLADLDRLAAWENAAPLKAVFHWMCEGTGAQLIHGGGVGRPDGGVLLAGPGGAGKSTTALACMGSGLKYLADDYCVIDLGEPGGPDARAMAYRIYRTAKLRPENLHRFESLRSRFAWDPGRAGAKPSIFLGDESTVASFPLRAIVLPRITGLGRTTWSRSPAGAAWRAIAPSTMWQLPFCRQDTFAKITALSRSLPVYELRAGTEMARIPGAIEELLEDAMTVAP